MPTRIEPAARPIDEPTADEIGMGYVNTYYRFYRHMSCQRVMRLGAQLAAAFATAPDSVALVWCDHHRAYVPIADCTWVDFDTIGDPRNPGVDTGIVLGS